MTLLNIIIESYSSILLAVGGTALILFILGCYFIFRHFRNQDDTLIVPGLTSPQAVKKPRRVSEKVSVPDTLSDVSAISGEDPLATQLDLAKAYIESGKGPLAKIILATVIRNGDAPYQEEAQRLLSTI